MDFLPIQQHLAAGHAVGADDGAHRLSAPSAHQAGEAQHLARMQGEGNVVHIVGGEVAHLQQHIPDLLVAVQRAVDIAKIAAHHHADQLSLVNLAGLDGVHIAAVLEDRDLVGDLKDLAHAVGHVDDDLVLVAQPADDAEQAVDLRIAKARGGLVKADDAQVLAAVGLHDLHHLLVGHVQVLDLVGGTDGQAEIGDDARGHLVGLVLVDHAQRICRHAAQIDVLGHGKLHEDLALLVDDAHARLNGLVRIAEMNLLAVDEVLSGAWLVVAVEGFEQRGLAGAVLAQESEHLAAVGRKADVVQRLYARKVFGDVSKLQRVAH